jgi:lipoprotein-anchoring transpeptidase ErfK/SrfK
MIDRRTILASLAASAIVGTRPALSHISLPEYTIPEEQMPREVAIPDDVKPFEIHVVPQLFALYWTLPEKRAIQYTVGIGRAGLYHTGEFYVGAKKKWPSWTPTPEMIKRDPNAYAQFADGMPGGLNNPLGARALYLFQPGRGDTYLRIHGTNNPRTIGRAVSNGCARLVNDQIVELYERVPLNTRVALYPKA